MGIKELIQGMTPETMAIIQGKVISENPLEIQVLNDDKLILKNNNICLPSHLTNTAIKCDIELGDGIIESETELGGNHPHGESGTHPHGPGGRHPHGESGVHEHTLPDDEIIDGGAHEHPDTEGEHEHPDTEGKHKHPDTEGKHINKLRTFNIYSAEIKIYNALKVGEIVYILSFNEGKKYYILDRER